MKAEPKALLIASESIHEAVRGLWCLDGDLLLLTQRHLLFATNNSFDAVAQPLDYDVFPLYVCRPFELSDTMADPLSIAAGVIGILTAAAQVSHLLIDFTKNSKDAPQTAKTVLTEVNEISGTLSQLEPFLLGEDTPYPSRAELLQIDQIITVLSGCVLTFTELEKMMDTLKTDDMGIRDCVRWARKEKSIGGLVQRLQNHKVSLSLVLHIVNR